MPKKRRSKKGMKGLMGVVLWLTGVLVSLAVGFGLVGETLTIPYIAPIVTVVAGWIVLVMVILSAVMSAMNYFK